MCVLFLSDSLFLFLRYQAITDRINKRMQGQINEDSYFENFMLLYRVNLANANKPMFIEGV